MSTATVSGTGAMCELRPELPAPVAGLYLRHRSQGFVAYVTASRDNLRALRRQSATVLEAYGVAPEAIDDVQLVITELYANAVQACGEHVPLVVDVHTTWTGVAVHVHDPAPAVLPRRSAAPDDAEAESGRGLVLLDVLAPGWTIRRSPIGKQICCHLRTPGT
ncbi:ATP-binding protein [Streptomyces sp. NBC_01381]|uniref:ATP-binding protein n=1 Tax=Streptomyces sp. NBC_01381 TaxID=2903845 RepID=UPI00225A6897|nr:ATP-binding protein [Streptomyces sp. NBC_01381]MCX4673626.1 ATP-binding protein [Streptomyces sp. NBC_01381]